MGWHLEAWTRPGVGTFERKVAYVAAARVEFTKELSGFGQGRAWIPAGDTRLSDIIDDTTDTYSLLRCYQDGTLRGEFYADLAQYNEADSATGFVQISGPGINSALGHAVLFPYRYTDIPAGEVDPQPDWIFGGDSLAVETNTGFIGGFYNGGFEDAASISNLGFENGNLNQWDNTSSLGGLFTGATGIEVSNTGAESGTYLAEVDPTGQWSGMWRQFPCFPGKSYTITAKIKEATANGERYVAGVNLEGAMSHTNAYRFAGVAMAELDNAAEGAGASDGTWQDVTLTVVAGSGQTIFNLYFLYFDTGSNGAPFQVDSVTVSGDSIGTDPWQIYARVSELSVDSTIKRSGSNSMKFTAEAGGTIANKGIQTGATSVQPYSTVTFSGWVYQNSGSAKDITFVIKNVDGPWINSNGGANVPSGTWTRVSVSALIEAQTQVQLSIRSAETTSETWYIDDLEFTAGLDIKTLGDIWDTLMNDASTFHAADARGATLDWLTPTFTAALDSNGDAWADGEVSIRFDVGMSYSAIMQQCINAFGIEYQIRWDEGDSRFEFDIFNPSGLGTDHTTADNPAILTGTLLEGSPVQKRSPRASSVLTQGLDGFFGESQSASAISKIGKIEAYGSDRDLLTQTEIDTFATTLRDQNTGQTISAKVTLKERDGGSQPWTGYDVGDTLNVTMADLPKTARRVHSITTRWTGDDGEGRATYDVDLNVATYTSGPSGTAAAVLKLLREWKERSRQRPDTDAATSAIAPGGMIPFTVAASNSTDEWRAAAMYLCDGVDDWVEVQDACDRLAATGGTIVLCEGTFIPENSPLVSPDGVQFRGFGQEASIVQTYNSRTADVVQYGAGFAWRDIGVVEVVCGT